MVVGVCRLRLRLHAVASLKQKRGIVKKIIGRVQSRFDVAIAEVECNDQLLVAVLGIAAVGNERTHVNSVLDRVLNFIDSLYLAEPAEQHIELMHL